MMALLPRRSVALLGTPGPALQAAAELLAPLARAHGLQLDEATPLQTAFAADPSLSDPGDRQRALQAHRPHLLTLLLPAQAEMARWSDAESGLRARLIEGNLPFCVLHAQIGTLAEAAVAAMEAALAPKDGQAAARWRWQCPDCDDGSCERHSLAAASTAGASSPERG